MEHSADRPDHTRRGRPHAHGRRPGAETGGARGKTPLGGLPRIWLAALLALAAQAAAAQERWAGSATLDAIVEEEIRAGRIPGAVLLVGREGRVLHRRAYGARAVTPKREPMTADTIFDAASLTKVVATAPAIARLFEQGKLRLNERVTEYLPEFQGGRSPITVRHLLTHFSGLRPDLDLAPEWRGYETGVGKALADQPVAEPGERFLYSDINYLLLGEIVRRLTGQELPAYVRASFYEPLGMRDTMFRPGRELRPRIAPTETVPGRMEPLRGEVHDPTARFMGGVAGHAGLFTTAGDLARYAEMLLALGELDGRRVLQPLTVRKMISPQSPADQPVLRGIGWDIDSPHSSTRGELFPLGSYGHTGFTGTSLWIDPVSRAYVILMTNRVHPRDRGPITSLRSRVATAAAAALGIDVPGVELTGYNETVAGAGARRRAVRDGAVQTGLDVLAASGFELLRGRRVGLITNHTGLSRDGRRNVDLMVEGGVRLTALFSPEHGWEGQSDADDVGHTRDRATGVRVWSLHLDGNRRPTPEMLRDVDILVFDVQDAGARFYTYVCTMLYAMEEAARRGIPFAVLDRPNPVTGVHVEGPVLDAGLECFVGCASLPVRHGMTLGEIARMVSAERRSGVRLEVVAMQGWERGDWFDATGLVWVNPSPNLRSLNAAVLYPGLALLEASPNYSVGRGTDSPFEQVGAPWIREQELSAYLNRRRIPGVRVYPTRFRPQSSVLAGTGLSGVRFLVTDRDAVNSVRLGLEVAAALRSLYPGHVRIRPNARLIGDAATLQALEDGADPAAAAEGFAEELEEFLRVRARYLLY